MRTARLLPVSPGMHCAGGLVGGVPGPGGSGPKGCLVPEGVPGRGVPASGREGVSQHAMGQNHRHV